MRAGAFGLSLVSDPLDIQVLRALEAAPLSLISLRRTVGSPPQTTVRKHLRRLNDLGTLKKCREEGFPAAVSYELSPSGRDLLSVSAAVGRWLDDCPEGALRLGTAAGKSAIKALIDGWSTKMLRALAVRPFSLTELDRLLSDINYPALERRLAAMRMAGQIVPDDSRKGGTPYKVSGWLRRAVGPLSASADWERQHAAESIQPLSRMDLEALFLLAVPLVNLPSDIDGSVRLAVDLSTAGGDSTAGAVVTVERGRLVSCVSDLRGNIECSATGSISAWLDALAGRDESGIESAGPGDLAGAIIAGLRRALDSRSGQLPVA